MCLSVMHFRRKSTEYNQPLANVNGNEICMLFNMTHGKILLTLQLSWWSTLLEFWFSPIAIRRLLPNFVSRQFFLLLILSLSLCLCSSTYPRFSPLDDMKLLGVKFFSYSRFIPDGILDDFLLRFFAWIYLTRSITSSLEFFLLCAWTMNPFFMFQTLEWEQ